MPIQSAEVRAQRMITKAFIDADSLEVVLYRAGKLSDGAGGVVEGSPSPLPPQVLRLIPLADGSDERFTADGKAVRPTYMLQGMFDADIERFDTFTHRGSRFEVVFVNENRQYQVKAEVVYRGQ
jgi:hypothetical protein